MTLVAVAGQVDADNAHLISELVDSLTRNQSQRLVLDLAQVTYLSAAGVEALLRVRDAVTARAGRLILRDPSPIVLTVPAGTRGDPRLPPARHPWPSPVDPGRAARVPAVAG